MTSFNIEDNKLSITKEVTQLDTFVIDLIFIVKKYARYVIISGYVSIFFGRARATEDIDIFIERLSYSRFQNLLLELRDLGYETNEDSTDRLYHEYLDKGLSINIWKRDFPLLRLEIKFALKKSQNTVLENAVEILLNKEHRLFFTNIESQIAYKRYIAKSDKDFEDARHLEIVFDNIDKKKVMYYKKLFLGDFNAR
jgi:hypothetical protein